MKHTATVTTSLAIPLLALAACAEPIDERSEPYPTDTAIPVEPDGGTGDGAAPLPDLTEATIPKSLHGRWGINPEDCTDENGDAKGSIQISENELRFYESRARLDDVSQVDANSIRASFAFAGEGEEWTREVELKLSDDGTQLVRVEFGEDALTDPLTYTKCPA